MHTASVAQTPDDESPLLFYARWMEQASCLDEDPETFFPVSETGPGLEQVAIAKEICHDCPVKRECLQHALDFGEKVGIWGGTTPEERRLLRRRAS